jgi:hypothetical protein
MHRTVHCEKEPTRCTFFSFISVVFFLILYDDPMMVMCDWNMQLLFKIIHEVQSKHKFTTCIF